MKRVLMLIMVLAAISCKETKKENQENPVVEEVAKPEIKLYAFDGGTVMANNLNLFAQGDTYKGESKELSDAFFVIVHPKGTLLWDTGLPEMLVGNDPYTTPDGSFTISRKDSTLQQLKSIGLDSSNVDIIAFSHIHFDHTGGANHFPNAKWLIQQTEEDFINSDAIKGNSFYAPDSFSKLKNKKILNGDYDVFGDGTVVIKYYPGHTAGHQTLFLDLPNEGPTMLSGDIYHFEANRENGIVPQFNYDIPESEASIKAFEEFVKEKNAKVYIQHDKGNFDSMPKSPNYLN
ncbi:N-acyl homoserine lactonase family protein [Sediminicola arcticus]|jgi:N-acyl homoserine lactone hydrolase|uniref:N-acyl homoserine lactonase family protein n=1 Tax=Sediminicola arcticus TaxID=1574308 RepID=A0ABV2SR29_9FLAO